MGTIVNRRDFLKFLSGAAVGTVASPLPWKLLDDTAIWTQNWSWLARTPRGRIQTAFTHCALCPGGCGVRLLSVNRHPFYLSGVAGHPVSHGSLCPLGLGGHHLSYHPGRLTTPQKRIGGLESDSYEALSPDAAVALLATWVVRARKEGGDGAVAVLDNRPGRALSRIYRRFLAMLGSGNYIIGPAEDTSFATLDQMLEEPYGPLGTDLEHTRTILSIGAPLLEGWGSPGRIARLLSLKPEHRPAIIQVETRPSVSALHADHWLRIRPGTEAAFALGMAHVIVSERLYDAELIHAKTADAAPGTAYRSLIEELSPERTGEITGLPPDEIRAVARRFAEQGPSIAIAGVDPGGGTLGRAEEIAIWGLNLLAGSVGRKGGFLPRRPLPPIDGEEDDDTLPVRDIEQVPDGSVHVLIVDAASSGYALPWKKIQRKLADVDAHVVSLSPFLPGRDLSTDLAIPGPAPMESYEEVTASSDAPVACFALSLPHMPRRGETLDPAEVIARLAELAQTGSPLAEGASSYAEELRRQADAIFRTGRGMLFVSESEKVSPMKDVRSSVELWSALASGGCWLDERAPSRPLARFTLLGRGKQLGSKLPGIFDGRRGRDAERALTLMPFGCRGASGDRPVPPLLAKLYRESPLRAPAGHGFVNAETGTYFGLKNGAPALLETANGNLEVIVSFDAAVLPGVIHVSTGPAPRSFGDAPKEDVTQVLDICSIDEDGVWRVTPTKIWRSKWKPPEKAASDTAR